MNKPETELTLPFLLEVLELVEQQWREFDFERGFTKGGLDGAIARGEEPVIKRLRHVVATWEGSIYVRWPDGFMAPLSELDELIRGGRSDDVERLRVLEFDTTGHPRKWQRL